MSGAGRGLREMALALREGRRDATTTVEAALAAIEAWEPHLNAVAYLRRDEALREARTLDAEVVAGRDPGPLHGVPVAVKDLMGVQGAPTGFGSRVGRVAAAERDAEAVRRLREAGAIVVAKTNLLEYAYGAVHPEVGDTRNPHDLARTSGGSSGGSAALVAAGCVPVALGTDTGGSVRVPAAYCGVAGVKPTPGRVPMEGVFPLAWSLDALGALTRDAADAVLVHDVLEGHPSGDAPVERRAASDVVLGVPRDWVEAAMPAPAVRAAWEAAVSAAQSTGARVVEVSFAAFHDANEVLLDLLLPEASVIHERNVRDHPDGYGPATRTQIEAGFALPAVRYVRARRRQQAARHAYLAWLDEVAGVRVDAVISPTVPFQAPSEDPSVHGEEGASEMHFTGPFNLLGAPAIAIPWGMADGVPVGVQLAGRPDDDPALWRLAAALSAHAPATPVPSVPD